MRIDMPNPQAIRPVPSPTDITPEQILELRALEVPPRGAPPNLNDLCDIALGHRFSYEERYHARVELAGVYASWMAVL